MKKIVGNVYGDWTVISDVLYGLKVMCKCKCGDVHYVNKSNLTTGKSFGCSKCKSKKIHKEKYLDGVSCKCDEHNGIYVSYRAMLGRCYHKTTNSYNNYGGKGISVCEDWKNDFETFKKWSIENGWKSGLVIDRKNPSKNYEPSNCRWITRSENSKIANIGKKNIHRKIDDDTVRSIRSEVLCQKANNKNTIKTISERYGVSRRMCEAIRQNLQYKDVR